MCKRSRPRKSEPQWDRRIYQRLLYGGDIVPDRVERGHFGADGDRVNKPTSPLIEWRNLPIRTAYYLNGSVRTRDGRVGSTCRCQVVPGSLRVVSIAAVVTLVGVHQLLFANNNRKYNNVHNHLQQVLLLVIPYLIIGTCMDSLSGGSCSVRNWPLLNPEYLC